MGKMSSRPAPRSSGRATAGSLSRLIFVDHLRAALVILVVLHHVALVYGASVVPFYYFEPPLTDPLAFLALLVFALFNQAWFMGGFFLLAGYFTPGSYDRKGPGEFLRSRLIRLGIPTVLFIFVLGPISWIGLFQMPVELTGISSPLSWESYPRLLGIGPLWFVALLLIFSFGYAACRVLIRSGGDDSESSDSPPSYGAVGIFILGLALVSYLLRMLIPLGRSVSLFTDVLSFPTLAYLPQYLSFFVLGVVASRRDWFRTIPGSMGGAGLIAAILVGVFLFPLAFSGHWLSLELSDSLNSAFGHGRWQSAVYALWDSAFAVGMCLGLVPLFRRFLNSRGALGRSLSRHSYAVYVFHIPTVVFVALALRGVALSPLLKFGLAGVISVPASFAVASLVRRLPLASGVL
jgi:hypothetical protein